jgi:hypothetical protein
MNVAGMVAAADLMLQHQSQARMNYAAVLRLRLDVGSRRIVQLINGTLSLAAWGAIHSQAVTPPATRELRSCSHYRRPGSAAGAAS